MGLTNAERQKRFRQKLREQASAGITPDDVRRAGRAMVDRWHAEGDPDCEWSKWRASAAAEEKKVRGGRYWADLFRWLKPGEIEDGEFGDDTDLVRRVALVALAMRTLPDE